ncbi:MAG TPA: hypothetical protein VGQ06_11270 [Gemmatimonadales bacterium]|jgi:hypothetical protein|nr:hypothetical protein [Gemmatimonadales bacterium]
MTTVVISPCKVASFPEGGGHFWVYLQYAHGLRLLGCDVYWLEQLRAADPDQEARLTAIFLAKMKRYGLGGRTFLYARDRIGEDDPGSLRFIAGSRTAAEAVLRRADLLLNFHYRIDSRLLGCVRGRTALVDIDPGLLQFWMSTGQITAAPHDRYLTTGETVGAPGTRIPDCGLPWVRVRPPVCLELWPFTHTPRARAFTTVSSWASADWLAIKENGRTVLRENTKRLAFLEHVDLPLHTRQPLELALYLVADHEDDQQDRAQLLRHGWRVRDSRRVAGTPEAYRRYVQRSRGEFSCAKASCMEFQNAWISDRTLCYLASGKPVVVQHTGPSAYLPNGAGMFRFSSSAEALQALEEINADYGRHCQAARAIAETHFDARRVLEGVLNAALDGFPVHATQPEAASHR